MGFAFNPFTGNFDQKGSGGGASYIDGEEATYNDLSLDAGVAPLNSAWLVRNSSGIWPFNKPGGIYIRTATGGVSRDADYTYAGTMPDVFSDAVLTIYDEASTTRTGQFNLGSVTAGQNRVLTWPNANGTIARTEDFAAPPAIGNTTPSTGAFTTLSANNGTLTASASALTLSQTWNGTTGTAFHLCTIGITNATPWTASAASSTLFRVQFGGANAFSVGYTGNTTAAGTVVASGFAANGTLQLSSNINFGGGTSQAGDIWSGSALKLRLWNLGNPSSATNFERANLRWDGNEFIIDVSNGGTGQLRGIKLGSATSSLLGFYGVTPVDQPATVADPAGGGTVDAEARTAINAIIDRLQEVGLIA